MKDLRIIDRDLRNVLLIDNVYFCLLRRRIVTVFNLTMAFQSFPFTTIKQISS